MARSAREMRTNLLIIPVLLSMIFPHCCCFSSSSLLDVSSCFEPRCYAAAAAQFGFSSSPSLSSLTDFCFPGGGGRGDLRIVAAEEHGHQMAEVALQHLTGTQMLRSIAVDYGHEVVEHNHDEQEIAITFDERGGARWRTHVQFSAGVFTVKIKTPDGNTSGLNTCFYLSSLEGDKSQDEIDFEFLGKDKAILQTNYFSLGTGNHEEIHQLGFDSSEDFHEYSVHWLPSRIDWLIDGKVIRTVHKEDGEAFPQKPMFLYAAIWNAGDIDEGRWAGPYLGCDTPYVCKYRDVIVPSHETFTLSPSAEEPAT